MSKSHWVPSPPVGVGLAIVLALSLAAGLGEHRQYTECRERRASEDCANALDSVRRAVISPVDEPEAPPREPNPTREQWRSEQDLAAQWDQARWAFLAAFGACFGVIVGAIGIFFIKQTLDATRVAVEQSAIAAEASVVAAKATRDSVDLSLRSFGLMHRPRLRVRNITIPKLVDGEPITIEGEIANVGDTNAFVHVKVVSVRVGRDKSPVIHDKPELQYIGTASVPAAGEGPRAEWAPAGGHSKFSLQTDLIYRNQTRFHVERMVARGVIIYSGTYPGDPADLVLSGKQHRSVDRKTAFERAFTGDVRDGPPYRFIRAEKPDPEREYED